MTNGTPQERPFLAKITNSPAYFYFMAAVSVFLYIQDIFQDILVMSSSLASPAIHVVSKLTIPEQRLGYFMVCVFILSVIIVGWDTIRKGKQLMLVKNHRWMYVLMLITCLLNLGPVFFILVNIFLKTEWFKRLYNSAKEFQQDQRQLELALSSTKTKEALFENMPMLVIVCFKMALSSQFVLLELFSSFSSACLLARTILTYVMGKKTIPLNFMEKVIGSLLLGIFIFITLTMINSFAIESERDGILIPLDPTKEDSAGLVFIFMLIPTILFCFIPFSIYDLIPFMFPNSFLVWEYFQRPPKKAWILLSVILCSLALSFNLATAWYLFRR